MLAHGIGDRLETWGPVVDRLAAERDVIALDLPGFGRSAPLEGRPTVEAQADWLAGWVRSLGIERWHVAGNSMGGGIALELARRGTVASATALSPIGFWTPREAAYAHASLRMTITLTRRFAPQMAVVTRNPVARTLLLGQLYGKPWRVPADALEEGFAMLAGAPSFDAALEAITGWLPNGRPQVPTTVAWGEHDWLLLPRQARRARRAWPEARHVWLTGCGHVPTFDDPEQVARVLLEGSEAA